MNKSEKINELASALCKFQGSMFSVFKDAKAHNYTYATLANVWDAIRMPLLENGLSVVQDTVTTDQGVCVTTIVFHTSGEWVELGPINVPMAKKDAHATGSATTYGRRYGLCAALGIVVDEDDNGSGANGDQSDEEAIKTFLEKYDKDYGKDSIIEFIRFRAEHLGIKERPIVRTYLKNDAGFRKDYYAWVEKKAAIEQDEVAK